MLEASLSTFLGEQTAFGEKPSDSTGRKFSRLSRDLTSSVWRFRQGQLIR